MSGEFDNVSVEDFEKLKPLVCEVQWGDEKGWVGCGNKAAWVGIGHDEGDCTTPNAPMIICDSCYSLSLLYKVGHCGHYLFTDARPL